MKDRVVRDIGVTEPLQDWDDIDWSLVEKRVRDLRQRIFRATTREEWNQVRSLTKLMLRSYSNLLLCVRKVTQENKGKKTPGIDHQVVLTVKRRISLVQQMSTLQAWRVNPGRRVYIPKANGKRRPLGILTIKNRVAQAIVKNALEPSWEAQFESNSYGFRPGRSCHDAIKQCWTRLNKRKTHRWVLDADVAAAFDTISQSHILERIGPVPGKALIKQWLKAGYVEAESFHATTSGVQQGGVISPLLANVALDGLEKLLSSKKAGYIRYADDLVVTARSKQEIEALVPTVEHFLAERGLKLNAEKTRIVHVKDGFNFLGFHVRSYNDRCIVKPQKEKVHGLLKKVRLWLKQNRSAKAENVIIRFNRWLPAWANYYSHVNSKQTFQYVDSEIWWAIWRWCLRRHPNKSKGWIRRKYFKYQPNRAWTFFATVSAANGTRRDILLTQVCKTPIKYHVKVAGASSPDDPGLQTYWEKRRKRMPAETEDSPWHPLVV